MVNFKSLVSTGTLNGLESDPIFIGMFGQPNGAATLDGTSNVPLSQLGNVPGGGGSPLEFIEKIVVAGGPVDTVTFSGLDGDVDTNYLIKAMFKADPLGGFCGLRFRPNGLATNQSGVRIKTDGTTVTTGPQSFFAIGDLNGDPSHTYSEILFRATKANTTPRVFKCETIEDPTGTVVMKQAIGWWNETTINVTSLELSADTSDSIANGSTFELYRIVPQ